jgi:hypothetical protein
VRVVRSPSDAIEVKAAGDRWTLIVEGICVARGEGVEEHVAALEAQRDELRRRATGVVSPERRARLNEIAHELAEAADYWRRSR